MQLNPFLSVWTQPKETVRQVVENKTVWFTVLIGAITGIGSVLASGQDSGVNSSISFGLILLLALLIGPIFGIVSVLLGGVFYTWIGRMLGGTGQMNTMIRAMGAMAIPQIVLTLTYVVYVLLYGELFFSAPEPATFAITSIPIGAYIVLMLITITFGLWGTVITCKGIGIVHNFSSWKGLGTVLIIAGIILILAIIVGIFAVAIMLS